MQASNGSVRARRLRRNPYYQYMRENNIRSAKAASQLGYDSVSAMYKALRFERMPDHEKLTKMGKILGKSAGDLFELWSKEMTAAERSAERKTA